MDPNHSLVTYFNMLNCDNMNFKYNEFDLILGGGGLRGYYHIGLCKILKYYETKKQIKIRNIIGVSAGAISAITYACSLDDDLWIKSYYQIKKLNNIYDLDIAVIEVIKNILPKDAYLLCTKKIKIGLSKLTLFGFQETYIDKFDSNEHLLNVLSAAIKIPFFTTSSIFGQTINNYIYYDGFLTNNVLPIVYNNDIPQLVIDTQKIIYPGYLSLVPVDSFIELLVIRGFYESLQFFNEEHTDDVLFPLKWLKKDTPRKLNIIQRNLHIIIPAVFYFILSKFNQ